MFLVTYEVCIFFNFELEAVFAANPQLYVSSYTASASVGEWHSFPVSRENSQQHRHQVLTYPISCRPRTRRASPSTPTPSRPSGGASSSPPPGGAQPQPGRSRFIRTYFGLKRQALIRHHANKMSVIGGSNMSGTSDHFFLQPKIKL